MGRAIGPGLALALALAGSYAEGALALTEGHWVVADPDANSVYEMDPVGLGTTLISAGGSFRYPTGVAVHPNGAVFVADPDANAIFEVDPLTGSQALVSQDGLFRGPTGVGVAADGDLLVVFTAIEKQVVARQTR